MDKGERECPGPTRGLAVDNHDPLTSTKLYCLGHKGVKDLPNGVMQLFHHL